MRKKLLLILTVAIFILLSFDARLALAASAVPQPLNNIVAIINDQVITQYDLGRRVQVAEQSVKQAAAAQQVQVPPLAVIQQQVLNDMIIELLELQRAKDMHISISTAKLNQQVETIASNQHISVTELYQRAEQAGLDRAAYRDQLKREMTIHELVQRVVVPKVQISDHDVAIYKKSQAALASENQEYHVRNIVFPFPNNAPSSQQVQAVEAKAQKLLSQINAGNITFAQAALDHTAGDHSSNGGDLGWRPAAELPEVFVQALVHMQVGQISEPIKADNGIHLIELISVRNTDKALTDSDIKSLLFKRQLSDALDRWEQNLRASAYVKII